MARNRPHLPLRTGQDRSYTYPGPAPRDSFATPHRIRQDHAARLRAALKAAEQRAEELAELREQRGLAKQRGITVEVRSQSDFALALKSLDSHAFQLLSSHEENGVTVALVFIPDGKLLNFVRLIEAYEKKETASGKPRHQPLLESIETIGEAALEALWTDAPEDWPRPHERIWWEVWLADRPDMEANVLDYFHEHAPKSGVNLQGKERHIRFPERYVILAEATRDNLKDSFEVLNCISELRRPRSTAYSLIRESPRSQMQWVADLHDRTEAAPHTAPAVTILDHGINRSHPLLENSLAEADTLSVNPDWPSSDQHGHGTAMAGIALYGDLFAALERVDPIRLQHRLESVRLLHQQQPHDPELYGEVTARAVSMVEIQSPERSRVLCLPVTLPGDTGGAPGSWSAAIDQHAGGGDDDKFRLYVLSAGNVQDPAQWLHYPESNAAAQVEEPGQSWNSLVVGAYTKKTSIDPEDLSKFGDFSAVAPHEGLSPFSRTSLQWERWPYRPDLVHEGGNAAVSPEGQSDQPDSLSLLTTYHRFTERAFTTFNMTSAAAAAVAREAAILQARYPEYWPETIRALLVHTAEWTPEMLRERDMTNLVHVEELLRTCGYGVPSAERASYSAENVLHLVAQDELQPFHKDGAYIKTANMKYYPLPWPREVLRDLGEEDVELRMTLSYFVEPDPARRGFHHTFQYPSHGLRLRLKRRGEDNEQFLERINKEERDATTSSERAASDGKQWLLGDQKRNKGCLLHDRWNGSAADLAARDAVAVCPVNGWWRYRKRAKRHDRKARYSLVLSIHTQEADVYTPVAQRIQIDAT